MILFLQLGFLTLAALLLFYGVGAGLLQLVGAAPRERYLALFIALIVGLSTASCSYAVYCTRGATIMLPVLLLLGVLLWLLRQPPHMPREANELPLSRTGWRALPFLLVLGVFVFLTRYLLLVDFSSEYLKTPFQDYVFYARLITPLTQVGIETNSLEVLYPQFLITRPYHYLEIWCGALLVRATGLPAVWCVFLSAFSVMITIAGAGFVAIFAHFRVRRSWVVVLSVLLLTATGTVWPFLQHIQLIKNGELLASLLLPLQPKLAPIYWFLLLGTSLLLARQYVAAAVALAIVPLISVAAAPAVAGGVLVLALYLWLTRQVSFAGMAAMVAPIIVAGAYIGGFYVITHAGTYNFPGTGQRIMLRSVIPQIGELKTLVNIALGVLVNFGVYFMGYSLLVLVLLLASRQPLAILKEHRVELVWFAASLLVAAITRTLAHHFLDGFQFFSNPMVPFTPIILTVLLAASLRYAQPSMYALSVLVLLGLLLVNNYKLFTDTHLGHVTTRYSPAFLRQMAQVLPTLGARGGYLLADAEYVSSYTLSSSSYTAGNYVSNFKNDYALISLSALDPDSLTTDPRFVRDSAQAEQIVRESTLFRFAKFQALRHRASSLDSMKYQLVRQARLSFICTSRAARLPAVLQPLVETSYTDSYSGEKLYVLRGGRTRPTKNPYVKPRR